MKILVVASSTGNTAPGKVFSKYINLLRKNNIDLTIISNDSSVDAFLYKLFGVHPRIKKLCVSLLGCDVVDYISARRLAAHFDADYDVIITMMSANHFFPLYAGYLYKRQFQAVKWINYCVDAIPAPEGWGLSKSYSNGLIRMIRQFMVKADKLYFSNQAMLEYQQGLLGGKFSGDYGVLYTLPSHGFLNLPINKDKKKFVLLYTGGVYQARKVGELLRAVEGLASDGVDLELNFVGTDPRAVDMTNVSTAAASKINFHAYVKDLVPFYQEADLLIDIDAAIENDVFISSKFFNYLMINRPILCITRGNSPVSRLTKGASIPDVHFATHEADEILKTIRRVMSMKLPVEQRDLAFIEGSDSFQQDILNASLKRHIE